MIIEPIANPLFLIPTGIVVIWDFLSLIFYLHWMKAGDFQKVRLLLLSKPVSTTICIYFMFTQFGGGFFLGTVYLLFSPIIALVMFVVLLVQIIRLRKELGFPTKRYILNLSGGLAIVFSLAIPSILYSPIKDGCADSNSSKVLIMSKALEEYYSENRNYPKTIEELTPVFLTRIPSPTCSMLSGFSNPFVLNTCNPDNPYIYTGTLDGMGYEYYSLKDGSRVRRHSFLDGGPNYCP